jgi:hypothetical protein
MQTEAVQNISLASVADHGFVDDPAAAVRGWTAVPLLAVGMASAADQMQSNRNAGTHLPGPTNNRVINDCIIDDLLHELRATRLPRDSGHVGPLLGNDELKLVLDARGCMHDFTPPAAWPPPRIVWTGRRHNQRIDRYNSNQFEYGFFHVALADEAALPPVTLWRQRLHPTEGYVETVIEREGGMVERAITFLCLDRNLLVCRRVYRQLPPGIRPQVRADYVFCQVGADAIPFRSTWTPSAPTADGVAADFTTDGHRLYRGRIAFFANRPCQAAMSGNRLSLEVPLDERGAVTILLAMEDDVGDDPQLMTVSEGDWMPNGVREVHRENEEQGRTRRNPDPAAALVATRTHVATVGFDGLLTEQKAAWQSYFARFRFSLPETEPRLAAALRGAIYHVRCGYSKYNWGSSPFNQSWGAHYAWNERYPVEGLLAWGVTDMPLRVMEWRRRILPFLSMRAAARGAFYHHSSVEPGTTTSERNATNFFELFIHGLIAHYLDLWRCYTGREEDWRRYYPVIRECAEFYRHWLLIELPGNNLMTVPVIDVNEAIYPVQDGPFTICSAARLFDLAVRGAERLGEDAGLLPIWRRYRDLAIALVRRRMRQDTSLRGLPVWTCYQDLELDTVPDPQLEIDPATAGWRDRYVREHAGIDQHRRDGQNVAGDRSKPRNWPWGAFQQVHAAATHGDPEQVRQALDRAFQVLLPFGGQCESAEEDYSRIDHPWFTTASGALLRGLARVFLHPRDGEARLLGGVPETWKDLSFELPAFDDMTVAVRVEAGKLVRLTLRAPPTASGRQMRLRVPQRFTSAATAWRPGVSVTAPDGGADLELAVTLTDTGKLELLP